MTEEYKLMGIKTLREVIEHRLCVGCGACAYVSRGALVMREFSDQGWRPVPTGLVDYEELPDDCLAVCPAAATTVPPSKGGAFSSEAFKAGLGPVLGMWEVHAGDPELRRQGASGGALSALGVSFCERMEMAGVLHIAQDRDDPFRNRPVLSRGREELLSRTGSRYAPASLCDGLHLLESVGAPCAVIGQPSEIAALRKIVRLRPELDARIGVTLSFFCAGSPARQGTEDLVRSHGIDPAKVTALRYRGRGWPGKFAVWVDGSDEPVLEMSYAESWAFLQRYRPWGVHLWPDGAGEHADISCGDPWYRAVAPGERGSSLVIARTRRGRDFVEAALADGDLIGEKIGWEKIARSQKNLLAKKGAIAGRLLAMRLLGLPVPEHRGYRMGSLWRGLTAGDKLRSVFGTARRIVRRGYRRPADVWAEPGESLEPTTR